MKNIEVAISQVPLGTRLSSYTHRGQRSLIHILSKQYWPELNYLFMARPRNIKFIWSKAIYSKNLGEYSFILLVSIFFPLTLMKGVSESANINQK